MSKMLDKTATNHSQKTVLSIEREMDGLSGLIRNLLGNNLESKNVLSILERIRSTFEYKEIHPRLKQDLVEAFVTCDAYLENFIPDYRIQDRLSQLLSSIKFFSV